MSLCFVFICLTACGSTTEEEDLEKYIKDIQSHPAIPIEPLPQLELIPKFTYPEGDPRRNPFKPIAAATKTDTSAPNLNRAKQPLEAFPLDALKFVGILKQGSTVWALIRQPSGMINRVKSGDFMGQNYGQVLLVKENAISLEETVQIAGKWEKRKIVIDLSKPQ